MKATRVKTVEVDTVDDIIATLKRVPKARLGIVRELVHALAAPLSPNGKQKPHAGKRPSLLDTPFCGMWADRADIADERTYARHLRRMLETGGDRRKNVR